MPWEIDGIEVEWVARETPPTLTRGDEVTLPLLFQDTGEATIIEPRDSGYSLNYGFNYEGPESKRPFRVAYDEILEYLAYRGEDVVRFGTTDRGVPWFRERLPSAAPVESLIVPVDAPERITEDRSMWAIIVDGEDVSNPLSSTRRIDLTLFVLAERDDYQTRTDVEAAFGDELTI